MRILILTSSYPRYDGDLSGNFVFDLAKELMKNFEIDILCPHSPKSKFSEQVASIHIYRFPYFFPLSKQLLYSDGGISYNYQRSTLAKIQLPIFFLSELIYSIYFAYKFKFALIHTHWLIPQGVIGGICKKLFRVNHVVTIHSSEVTVLKKIPLGKKIAEFVLTNSDFVVSVSDHRLIELLAFVSPDVQQQVIAKSSVVPMGVHLKAFQDSIQRSPNIDQTAKNQFKILFIGRLVEVKGCEFLINSIKLLTKSIPHVKLIIIGQGNLDDQLKAFVSQNKLEKFIEFLGYVDHDLIPSYLFHADIVAFPSIIDSSGFQEGLPVVLIEAMAAGKPIIATRTRGVEELITDQVNGLLVDPKNSIQMADGILDLYSNRELRNNISRNARESVTRYDWNIIGDYYSKIFHRLNDEN